MICLLSKHYPEHVALSAPAYMKILYKTCAVNVSTINKYTFTFICRSLKMFLKAVHSDCVVSKHLSHFFNCNFLILCFSNNSYYFLLSFRRRSASGFCSFTWHCPCITGMVNVTYALFWFIFMACRAIFMIAIHGV